MDALSRVFVALPAPAQHRLTDTLGRLGVLHWLPLFRMFIRCFAFAGARPDEVRRAIRSRERGFREAAARAAAEAETAAALGLREAAADSFHRATLYALSAAWGVASLEKRRELYRPGLAYAARYAELAAPKVQKIRVRCPVGEIPSLLRLPPRETRALVILFPGSDQTKEWMAPFESLALARGLATLAVDLPGFGENALAGTRLGQFDDLGPVCRALLAEIRRRFSPILPVGTFGVSLGGLFSLASSGWDARVQASAGVGSPLTTGHTHRVAAAQLEVALQWSGAPSEGALRRAFDVEHMQRHLAEVTARTLVVHGARDEVVDPRDARRIAALLGARSELQLLAANDHFCTQALERGAGATWFDWLAERLATGGAQVSAKSALHS